MDLSIRPLSPELAADYLDFFDHRAFSDGSPCYCCAFQMAKEQIQEEFLARFRDGGTEAARLAMRDCARRMIAGRCVQGYLAYGNGLVCWSCGRC